MSVPGPGTEDRLRAAHALLRASGVDGDVSEAGYQGEIVAVRAAASELPTLEGLAPRLRALGFRYVALELTAEPNQGST